MNKEQMTINQLYDLTKTIAGSMMEQYTYPWEVLPHIGEMIAAISAILPKDDYNCISGNIWIHKSVQMPPIATVKGPAIICANTEVRPGAFIRGNVIVGEGAVVGIGAVFLGPQLLDIYSSDMRVIQYGMNRLRLVCAPYFLCGMMEVMVGALRGVGCSLLPMFVSLTGACAFRVVWIFTVFAVRRTLPVLYISYPVSWAVTFLAHTICYLEIRRRMARKEGDQA